MKIMQSVLQLGAVAVMGIAMLAPATLQAQTPTAYGTFEGADDHAASGRVEAVQVEGELRLRFSEDFAVDQGPDVWVFLSKSNTVTEGGSVRLQMIKKFSGEQWYAFPPEMTAGDFTHVVLWCARFDTRMGIAELHSS